MKSNTIHTKFINYEKSLETWFKKKEPTEKDVVQILKTRDDLYLILQEAIPHKSNLFFDIQVLDKKLIQAAPKMSALMDFKAYRQSIPISPEQWWWNLDEKGNDWIFNGFTFTIWTFSLALLIDISRRFLLGSAGIVGLSAVILPSLLTLLKARNDFTEAGQKGIQKLLDKKIPFCKSSKSKFGFTILLALGLSGFWLFLPSISRRNNYLGQLDQEDGKLGSAEQHYKLAISLDPNNIDAHYNLGTFYEDIQDLDKAKTQYLIAASGNIPEAYNNLARLHLQPPKPNLKKAVAFLNQGLLFIDKPLSAPQIRYSLYKNLGWARLQQNYPQLAKPLLQTAIQISQKAGEKTILNAGSSHCLLAQVQEAEDPKTSKALVSWQRCCQLGSSSDPDEDTWILEAQKRIKIKKLDPNKLCRPNAKSIA